jgi:hypothetical protein
VSGVSLSWLGCFRFFKFWGGGVVVAVVAMVVCVDVVCLCLWVRGEGEEGGRESVGWQGHKGG